MLAALRIVNSQTPSCFAETEGRALFCLPCVPTGVRVLVVGFAPTVRRLGQWQPCSDRSSSRSTVTIRARTPSTVFARTDAPVRPLNEPSSSSSTLRHRRICVRISPTTTTVVRGPFRAWMRRPSPTCPSRPSHVRRRHRRRSRRLPPHLSLLVLRVVPPMVFGTTLCAFAPMVG